MFPCQMALRVSFLADIGAGFRAEIILLNCHPVGRRGQPAFREERRVGYGGERGVDLVDVVHQA